MSFKKKSTFPSEVQIVIKAAFCNLALLIYNPGVETGYSSRACNKTQSPFELNCIHLNSVEFVEINTLTFNT